MHHVTGKLSKSIGSNKIPSSLNSIDLNVFKDRNTECKPPPSESLLTESCPVLKRLCAASRYFDVMNTSKLDENEKKLLFVEFNEDMYDLVVDDTTHLVQKHSDDVQRINSEWTEKYGFPKCTVSDCAKSTRHYGRGRRETAKGNKQDNSDDDALYSFYESIYDRVHNFVAHLYDIGLRVDEEALLKKVGGDQKEEDSGNLLVDKYFKAERDHVRSMREQCNLDLDRLEDAINKYTIQSAELKKGGMTLMDALFEALRANENVSKETLRRIVDYVLQNHYDSDGIEMDLEDNTYSNLHYLVEDRLVVDSMASVIRNKNLNASLFSTGFKFNYWTKKPDHLTKESANKLTVKPKHDNLKDEVVGDFLTKARWVKLVVLKADKYLRSKAVRKITAQRALHGTPTGQIAKGAPITKEHLMAVILYCDFGALCTAFSATFRLQDVFEAIESLKQRHSAFAHFGRLLVETVLDYGINGYQDVRNLGYQRGPFFCGINCPLNIGSYAIRLNGPCSTSTKRSVAVNFAKSNGLIVKLNNDTWDGEKQCFFDCSWISNYFEESERLWIAAKNPLRLISIVIVRSAKNYQKFIRALYLFDAMLSGVNMYGCDGIKEQQSDFQLLSELINETLKGDGSGSKDFDIYLQNEWRLFIGNKKEVILDMDYIHDYFKTLSKLVVFKVVEYEWNDIPNGKENVIKEEWLSMFPSLETVTINTNAYVHKFGLKALMDSVAVMSPSITANVQDRDYWTRKALNEDVSAEYDAIGWNIEFVDEEEMLVIKSKSK